MDTRIKICGITRMEDARLAAELGASAIGFVFWPDSPRFIDPYRALPIVRLLPPFVATVGVLVDQPVEHVMAVAGLLNLGAIQLHGQERLDEYARPSNRLIKAVPVDDRFRPESIERVPAHVTVLLDAHDPVKRGGTGRTIDWTVAAAAARQRPIILSGGLTPDNAATAVEIVRPYAIDVSSGVESSPGVKDPDKMRALFSTFKTDTAHSG